jgi:hypothetical protein
MRRLLVLAALVVSGLAVFVPTSPANSIRKCIPNREAGIEVTNHVTVIVYCGSAKVTIVAAGQTTKYSGGACYKVAGSLNVDIGKFTTLHRATLYTAFVLVIPAAGDGTFNLAVLTIQHKGKKDLSANKIHVVVKGKRSRGAFSGKFLGGPKFTGSFTCK